MKLSDTFPPEAIHWRAQTVTKDGGKALALAYLDARDVMDRLDAVCGPYGWQDSYTETASGRVICTISILSNDGDWISKSDGAGNTAVEGEKGGISDAFKRAAVKWGVGRYLYDLGNVWAPCECRDGQGGKKQWAKWANGADRVFAAALNGCGVNTPATITDNQRDELMLLMEGLSFPVARLLDVSKITDLRQLRADKFEGAKGWIKSEASKMEKASA